MIERHTRIPSELVLSHSHTSNEQRTVHNQPDKFARQILTSQRHEKWLDLQNKAEVEHDAVASQAIETARHARHLQVRVEKLHGGVHAESRVRNGAGTVLVADVPRGQTGSRDGRKADDQVPHVDGFFDMIDFFIIIECHDGERAAEKNESVQAEFGPFEKKKWRKGDGGRSENQSLVSTHNSKPRTHLLLLASYSTVVLTDTISRHDAFLGDVKEERRQIQTPVEQNGGHGQLRIGRKSHVRFSHHGQAPDKGGEDRQAQNLVDMGGILLRDELFSPLAQRCHDLSLLAS